MDCPTDDQLRCLARGTEAGSGLGEHVRRCAACKNGWSHWPVIVACLRSCVRPGQTN